MKLLSVALTTLLIGFAAAGQLSNKYLPPNYAGSSGGGHANFLQSPSKYQGAASQPSNQYIAPHGGNGNGQHYHRVNGGAGGGGAHGGHGGHYAGAASAPVGAASYGHNGAAAQIPILRQHYSNDGSGNYNFDFETGNGIRRDETGVFEGGWPGGSQTVSGSYSYTGDDGKEYTVKYKADGNGFQATGDHLPTPPPIPPEIQESLELIRNAQASQSHQHGPSSYGGGGGNGGGHGGGHGGGNGGPAYYGAASAQSPSARYLPPPQHGQSAGGQGYHYGRRH